MDAVIITAGTGRHAVLHARSQSHRDRLPSAGCVRISVRDEAPLEENRPLAVSKGHGLDS